MPDSGASKPTRRTVRPRALIVSPSITVISLGLIASALDAVVVNGAPVTIFGSDGGAPVTIFGSGGFGCAKGRAEAAFRRRPTHRDCQEARDARQCKC